MDVGSSIARACVELTHSLRNLRLPGSRHDAAGQSSNKQGGHHVASTIKQRLFSGQSNKSEEAPRRRSRRYCDYLTPRLLSKADTPAKVMESRWAVQLVARCLSPYEASRMCCVCSQWRDALYCLTFWRHLRLRFPMRLCQEESRLLTALCRSLQCRRRIDSIVLTGLTDSQLPELLAGLAPVEENIVELTVHNAAVTDRGLASLVDALNCVTSLRVVGCNDLSEVGLWTFLPPRLVSLCIADCISVSDESVAAITQLLPRLASLELQAYHVTDSCMTFFASKQAANITCLTLNSCWEITNQGVLNLSNSLPCLQRLSLSGCSKITDDAVDIIADRMKQLKELDLSWCHRLTDVALECIACDLCQLEVLQLDRCTTISDIGIGYLSTMPKLRSLCLRWCASLSDTAIRHIIGLRTLSLLSLAGSNRVTGEGLCHLIRMRQLRSLELTNCPAATHQICDFLRQHLPTCRVVV